MNDVTKALSDAFSEIGELKQVIRELTVVCEMAHVEAITLQPRLNEPFAGHQRVLAEKCREALAHAERTVRA